MCAWNHLKKMGTMLLCNNYVRQRLRLEELYPEPTTTFGDCDCISYSYFFLSIVLFSFGSFVTVASLSGGGGNDFIFSNMGHMWLVGPICICSGMMIAIKIILYLRRKSVIQMLLRQRALLRVSWIKDLVNMYCTCNTKSRAVKVSRSKNKIYRII